MGSIESVRWPEGESYSQWLRRILGNVRGGGALLPLFDSSTAEPTDLLTQLAADTFSEPVSDRFTSGFAAGNPYLVRALSARYEVEPSQVMCAAGATSALNVLYHAFLRPGDHVLVESPGFDLFTDLAEALGVHVDRFERSPMDGSFDPQAVAKAIGPRTGLVVLSDLHNPTGFPLDYAALKKLADLAGQKGVPIAVDEVYREFAHPAGNSAFGLAPNIVIINSLTKVFGLSALRCGWLVADPSLTDRIRNVHERIEFGPSNITHSMGARVIENPALFETHWKGLLDDARPIITQALDDMAADGLIEYSMPDHGCICFPRLVNVRDTRVYCERLMQASGVVVAPGEYFGTSGHIRIGFSRDRTILLNALERLHAGLRSVRDGMARSMA